MANRYLWTFWAYNAEVCAKIKIHNNKHLPKRITKVK